MRVRRQNQYCQTWTIHTSEHVLRHPSVSRDYGNVLCMEELEQCLVWLRRPVRESQSLPHWRQIQSLSSQPARQGSLQIGRAHDAPPASRLNAQILRFLICWVPFLRASEPACRYPCIGSMVSLWGSFPALIFHIGDILESDHQPFSQRAQANIDFSVSVMYTC